MTPDITVRDLARAVGVTHSAASQTAALTEVLSRTERAVLSRPMRTRIADAARALAAEAVPAGGDPESAAGRRAALLAIAGDSEQDSR